MNEKKSDIFEASFAINPQILDSLRIMLGNDEIVFTQVVKCYLSESSQLLQDINAFLKNQNAQMIEQTAHKLKSSSASMGAVTLSQLCLQMEIMGQSGNLASSIDVFSQLEQEYQKVEMTLQKTISNN
ncbi:Hpt domain-containing protein [Anabaena sp. UHCC 0451]|uniref:Hpt domain-containing protein n=1 Tax=Anabaena sp. UHCC 0451 TaxID=2055235 RepID=UPI002B201240|nr:Hpt domain-containing protein [Anabaena sp. UHCC 0451]MEA5574874.1 Hpt domain-containing protein [Anabaena sp. UHCC 0451]